MKRILVLLLCLCVAFPACADPQRVFDNAGLFTADEVERLESLILEFQKQTKTDFAVLTTDDFLGNVTDEQIWQFANDFYDKMSLGYAPSSSGVLYYIDMYNCAPCISTCGLYTLILQDCLSDVFDAASPYLIRGQWMDAVEHTMDCIKTSFYAYWGQEQ